MQCLATWIEKSSTWKGTSLHRLHGLLLPLSTQPQDDGLAARKLLADEMWAGHLSDPKKTMDVPPQLLIESIMFAAPMLSAEQKAELARLMEERFVADAAVLEQLDAGNAQKLAVTVEAIAKDEAEGLLYRGLATAEWLKSRNLGELDIDAAMLLLPNLGSPDPRVQQARTQLSTAQVEKLLASDDLGRMAPSDVIGLSSILMPDVKEPAPMRQLAKVLYTRCVKDEATWAALSFADITSLVRVTAEISTGGERELLLDRINDRFGPDSAALRELSPGDVNILGSSFLRLGQDESSVGRLAAAWAQSAKLESLDAEQFETALRLLGGDRSPETLAAERRVGQAAWDQVLARPDQVARLPVATFAALATRVLAAEANETRTKALAEAVQRQYLQNEIQLVGLSPQEFGAVAALASSLKFEGSAIATAASTWLGSDLAPARLSAALQALSQSKRPGTAGAARNLAERVWQAWLSKADWVQAGSLPEVRMLVASAAPYLEPAQRQDLSGRLSTRFAEPALLSALSIDELRQHAALLNQLETSGQPRATLAATWLGQQETIEGMSLGELGQLTAMLAVRSEAIQSQAFEQVYAAWKDAAFAKGSPIDSLVASVAVLQGSLPIPEKQGLVAAFDDWFERSPQSLTQLSSSDLQSLLTGVQVEGREAQLGEWLVAWFAADLSRLELEPAVLERLMTPVFTGSQAAMQTRAAVMHKILPSLEQRHADGNLGFNEYRSIVSWLAVSELRDEAETWAERFYTHAMERSESLSLADLAPLGGSLYRAGALAEGVGHPAFAKALAKRIAEHREDHTEFFYFEYLGWMLGTDENRQVLHDVLFDENGCPRVVAAKCLTWSYQRAGRMSEWNALIEQSLADQAVLGDTRAGWLMARAYVAEVEPGELSPMRGSQWLTEAMSVAESERTRFDVVYWIAEASMRNGASQSASSLLDSVMEQFADAGLQVRLKQLREQVVVAASVATLPDAGQVERSRSSWRLDLEQRLATARAAGDAESVARIERLLQVRQ